MSTCYDALNPLFSSVDVMTEGKHTKITIFIKGQNAGTVTLLDSDEAQEFLQLLFTVKEAAIRVGLGLHALEPIAPGRLLLSEYGDLTTLREKDLI